MICPDGVDLLNLIAKGDSLVDEQLEELVRRGLAREQLELAVDRARPRDDDAERDLRRRNLVSTEAGVPTPSGRKLPSERRARRADGCGYGYVR